MGLNFHTLSLTSLSFFSNTTDSKFISQQVQTILDKELSRLVTQTNLPPILIIYISESAEPYWQKQFQEFLSQLTCKFKKILLTLNRYYKPFNLQFDHVAEILYVDDPLYRLYHSISVRKTCITMDNWNSTKTKILFMVGKPDKIHRSRLLFKLLDSPIAQHLSWSFMVKPEEYDSVRLVLSDLTKDEQETFFQTSQRQFDKYFGTPEAWAHINQSAYGDTVFQIISETDFDRPFSNTWLTEKIWLSMANHRPFVMAGELNTLTTLRELGFRTFEDYMDIPNYDDPDKENFLHYSQQSGKVGFFENLQSQKSWRNFYQQFKRDSWPDQLELDQIDTLPASLQQEIQRHYVEHIGSWSEIRLDAVVENAVSFHKNIARYAKYIAQDVEHNYQKFIELFEKNQLQLENFCRRHDLICDDVTQLWGSSFYFGKKL